MDIKELLPIIAKLVNFTILFILVFIFAKKPITLFLQSRISNIHNLYIKLDEDKKNAEEKYIMAQKYAEIIPSEYEKITKETEEKYSFIIENMKKESFVKINKMKESYLKEINNEIEKVKVKLIKEILKKIEERAKVIANEKMTKELDYLFIQREIFAFLEKNRQSVTQLELDK